MIAVEEAGHVLVIVILILDLDPDLTLGLVHDLVPRTGQPLVSDRRRGHALVRVPGSDQLKERMVTEVVVVAEADLGQRIDMNDHPVGRVSERDPLP